MTRQIGERNSASEIVHTTTMTISRSCDAVVPDHHKNSFRYPTGGVSPSVAETAQNVGVARFPAI